MTDTINYEIKKPNAIKTNSLESSFKVYPNPVSNIGNFKFYLKTPQNIKLRSLISVQVSDNFQRI